MRVGVLLSLALAACGCSTLPVIEAGECGNAVIEGDEACDTFADKKAGVSCRPPGDPYECQFDCRPDADGKRARCPEGRGCGADGICRKHLPGQFEMPVNFSTEASSVVSTADFDGDGRSDIISMEPVDQFDQARFRLHYFDVDARLVETRDFPRMTTPPLARDVTGDGRSDLLCNNFRVGLVPGRADREFVPAPFSSYMVADAGIRVVGARKDAVDHASPLVTLASLGGVDGLYTSDSRNGGLVLRAPVGHPLKRLAGPPFAADLFEGEGSPCDEVILAYRGDDYVTVYDMCEKGPGTTFHSEVVWREQPTAHVVRLPRGLRVGGAPLAADLNADGHLDLLINAGGKPYQARGDGAELEPSASNLHVEVDGEEGPVGRDSPDLIMPLAAGDFSGDSVVDFVFPESLIASRTVEGQIRYFGTYQNRGFPWTTALIADLNHNDVVDVVAAAEGLPGLSFFNGTGTRYEVATTLPTRGGVKLLATGDFDGDLVNDLVFMEAGSPTSSDDSLSVAFGRRDMPPLPAMHVADMPGVEQLGSFADFGIDSIFAASQERIGDADYSKVTLFEGGPDRQPIAPYSLVTFSTDGQLQDSLALAITAGSFSSPGSNDVVALGTQDLEQDWSAWLLPDIGRGQDPPRQLAAALPTDLKPVDFTRSKTLGVKLIAADVDGDGRDEVVALVSRGDAGCALLIYDVDGVRETAVERQRIDFEEPCLAPQLAAWDLDRDGDRAGAAHDGVDLLLLRGDSRELTILWNDRHGKFSIEDRSTVGDDVRAFSVFTKTSGLAFVTRDRLYTANTSAYAREYDRITERGVFHDLRSVVVADPTGDGIEDMAVADADGLWLISAKLK